MSSFSHLRVVFVWYVKPLTSWNPFGPTSGGHQKPCSFQGLIKKPIPKNSQRIARIFFLGGGLFGFLRLVLLVGGLDWHMNIRIAHFHNATTHIGVPMPQNMSHENEKNLGDFPWVILVVFQRDPGVLISWFLK